MATSIPLRCNLCPQEPEFSDLSHLLTHVSSKGHLSHHLKAQLRGRHEVDIRQKLDAYDRWYERYSIEQLLSKRLSAKVSRQDVNKERHGSDKPTRRPRVHKSRIKPSTSPRPLPSPIKNEDVIDPQLSNSHVFTQPTLDSPFRPTLPNSGKKSQTYVPRMSDWQVDSHTKLQQTYSASNSTSPVKDVDDQYFRSFIQSPLRAEYPDLPELKDSFRWSRPLSNRESPAKLQAPRTRVLARDEDKENDEDEADPLQSPVLKGIRWPGMSLFDSASLDAQRLRNQKKDRSILAQMAHNSMSVEQMEDIYWPDGNLKKRRLITGNVDSSPTSQPSPIPKRLRQTRTDRPRSVLAELSTNGPSIPKKRGRKPKVKQTSSINTRKEELPEERLAHPDNLSVHHSLSMNLTAAAEKPLLRDNSSLQPHQRAFQVFRDLSSQTPNTNHDSLDQNQKRFGTHSQSHSTGMKSGTRSTANTLNPLDSYNELASYVRTPSLAENSENVPPRPICQGQVECSEGSRGRITQRYFSLSGTDEPHFFDSMPPQMEFGGMSGPRYRGATLNPLNPLNPYFRALQPHTPHSWTPVAHAPSINSGKHYQRHAGSSKREGKASEAQDS